MNKTGHAKTIQCNTVGLCYLALGAFYAGFFSEINLISVKIIVLIDIFVIFNGF